MKKIILLVLLLVALPSFGQFTPTPRFQTQNTDVGGGTFDYGYAIPLLPHSEWRDRVDVVFEQSAITGWVANSSGQFSTLTLSTPTHMHGVYGPFSTWQVYEGETIVIRGWPGLAADTVCPVNSITDSTHIVIENLCDAGGLPFFVGSSSGSVTGAYYQMIEPARGSGISNRVNVEIVNTGSTTGTYFLTSGDRSQTAVGSPCSYNDRTPTCYIAHPILNNTYPGDWYLEVGPNQGNCTQTGTLAGNDVALHSDIEFDEKVTSVLGGATVSRHFIVCKDGAGKTGHGQVFIVPAWRPSFKNEQHEITAGVFGTNDPYVSWSMTSDSGTGDATLETVPAPTNDGFVVTAASAKKPSVVFHSGTVNTGYTITACADADSGGTPHCQSSRVYVAAQAKPAANTNGVEQLPCEVDPQMTAAGGVVYTIGPGQTYADLISAPTQSYPWGSTFFIKNTGGVGTPTSINNYAEWKIATNWASFASNTTIPMVAIIGCANTTSGELPIIEGSNATGSSNVGGFSGQDNLITVTGTRTGSLPLRQEYDGNLQAAHNVFVGGLYMQHANPNYNFCSPGLGPPCNVNGGPYLDADGSRVFATQQVSVIGNYFKEVANPVFADCNMHGGFYKNCALDHLIEGNVMEGYSITGRSTEHAIYCQTIRCYARGNRMLGGHGTDATGYFSFRADTVHFMYNGGYGVDGTYQTGALFGGNSEVQDANEYFNLNYAFGRPPGWNGTDCGGSTFYTPFCNDSNGPAAFGGVDTYAAFNAEHWKSFYFKGNVLHQVTGACSTGLAQSHALNGLEMARMLFYSYNTNDCPNLGNFGIVEDVRPPSGNNFFAAQPEVWPLAIVANNILWNSANATDSDCNHGFFQGNRVTTPIFWQTNVTKVGQYAMGNSDIPMNYWGGLAFCHHEFGINAGTAAYQFTGMEPMNAKFGVTWNPGNIIETATKPYNGNYVTLATSAATGVATAETYPASIYPLFFAPPTINGANDSTTGTPMARRARVDANKNPLDIGAFDVTGAVASPVSIAITPNPISITLPGTVSLACTTTLSDSSTRSCVSPSCSSTNTSAATVSFPVVSGVAAGSGNITCTAESLSAPAVPFTVSNPSPSGGPPSAGTSGNISITGTLRVN